MDLPKYPRTFHLEGSKGITNFESVLFSSLRGKYLVIEEKIDGSCVAIGFDNEILFIKHRNTDVRGSEFDLLKSYCAEHLEELYCFLQDKYILYGEWMFAKHSIFYDKLPNYFIEYDVFDRQGNFFLSTEERQKILPKFIVSAEILGKGNYSLLSELTQMVGPSKFISTKTSELMEGLYIKVEEDDRVVGRYKYIRKEFLDLILKNGHWLNRSLIVNQISGVL